MKHYAKTFLSQACVALLGFIALLAHATDEGTAEAARYSKQQPVTLTSEDQKYQVTLYSNVSPIPLNKIHSWTVQVIAADGKPVEHATIRIHGGMPAHRHGFPTSPRVKQYLGDGAYRIDGVKFSMPGNWEIRINIRQDEEMVRDRAVFEIDL